MRGTHTFGFNMSLARAKEKDGKKIVTLTVSDNQEDYHGSAMSEKALKDMQGMFKNGFLDDNGDKQQVYFLPEHKSTFEMGYGIDARINRLAGGVLELEADFQLINDNPTAEQLFREVKAGTCKKQASIGGDALVKPEYDQTKEKVIDRIVGIERLEHVACTRPGKAAVASTGFLSAIEKSLERIPESELRGIERGKMSDSERKKYATLVRDNTHSSTMYVDGDKAYLLPVPDGDVNAAKVALREMGRYSMTRKEGQAVHDRAVEVLGSDEHQADGYCSYCNNSDSRYWERSKEVEMTAEEFAALQKQTNDNATALETLTTLVKSLVPPSAEELARIKKEKDEAEEAASLTGGNAVLIKLMKSIQEGMAAQTEVIKELAKPGSRTNAGIAAGATAIEREKASTAGAAAAAAVAADGANEDPYADDKKHYSTLVKEIEDAARLVSNGGKLTDAERNGYVIKEREKIALRQTLRTLDPSWNPGS